MSPPPARRADRDVCPYAVGVRDDPDYVVSGGCQVPDLTRTGELATAKPTPGRILLAMTAKVTRELKQLRSRP